jgi:glycosyltransferase involved in cell wall biosynthesis
VHPRKPIVLVLDAEEVAGAEIHAASLIAELREDVDFVAVVNGRAPAELHTLLSDAGARVRVVRGLTRYATPGALLALVRELRALSPGLVHVNVTDPGDATPALVGARLWRGPSVATLHLSIPDRAAWREKVTGFCLRGVDRVIAISDAVGDYVRSAGIEPDVVPNGVKRPERAADPRGALGVDPHAFVVGGIGRLHGQKGWDVLCAAAELVRAELPDVEFVVVGEGEERERLEPVAARGGVRLAGYRPRASSLVHGFDVLAVPSRYEGFGLVAVEAMLSDVPVVASSVGGLPGVVGDAGLLVPPGDPQALAAAVLRLHGDPGLRAELARRGRARAEARFGIERMAQETLAVYRAAAPGTFGDVNRDTGAA